MTRHSFGRSAGLVVCSSVVRSWVVHSSVIRLSVVRSVESVDRRGGRSSVVRSVGLVGSVGRSFGCWWSGGSWLVHSVGSVGRSFRGGGGRSFGGVGGR